mmetsp:Transcript_19778/g.42414  ORF Transcript_19778/g.42414 Transcript_19778/m.42414 type:complete len:557 (+) Transcript_19778:108-1778(+)
MPAEYYGDIHASRAIDPEQWPHKNEDGGGDDSPPPPRVMAILLYGSWNMNIAKRRRGSDVVPPWVQTLNDALSSGAAGCAAAASVRVDADDESLEACARGSEDGGGLDAPSKLPSLLFLASSPADDVGADAGAASDEGSRRRARTTRVEHVRFGGAPLERLITRSSQTPSVDRRNLASSVADAWSRLFDEGGGSLPAEGKGDDEKREEVVEQSATRIFVAGDRSQVGKSSVCLGLMGALLKSGKYSPTDLAYIKPATQCEKTQLVERFCKSKGIESCVPVGPIVYYKGFTRAFLKGETGETSEQLLRKAGRAVDDLARGKRVVVIDGVGYPAVGSITGTDNASVAGACGAPLPAADGGRRPAPVLLVGKSGVGDAVDSFNINATYFAHKDVPVIGAVFNKLSLDGFYSLSNCREAVETYFRQSQPGRTAFGFLPVMPSLVDAGENNAGSSSSEEERSRRDLEAADEFAEEFSKRVDVERILEAARAATARYVAGRSGSKRTAEEMTGGASNSAGGRRRLVSAAPERKRLANGGGGGPSLTREQVEAMAAAAGASTA